MKIVCESCGAKYSIADEKVAGKVFKIRCKKCSAVIVVKGDQQQDGEESTRVFDYGGDAVWHVVVAGEQQGPFAPRQIGELLAEAKIDWEAYVWREGMDGWQPAKDVEALVAAVMAEAEGAEAPKNEQAGLSSGAIFGGSNDMGADPFAGSDDGGLAGVIASSPAKATSGAAATAARSGASAMAAGGGADLFADSTRSAFAAAADDDDDDDAQHGGPGPKVSEGQAMTGQRNENSVLFSLSNLQALATGSGATAPAAPRSKGGMAQGEGSGLIDIRALASATQAVGDRPSAGARKVEDLLAVGSSTTTFSATSFAAPVASEKPDRGRSLLYAMGAAVLLLGSAVLYLAVRDPAPTAQLTETQEPAPSAPATATGAAPSAPSGEPPPSAAAPAAEPPSENKPAEETAARDEQAEGDDNERNREGRSERRRRSGESSSKSTEKEKEAAPAPVAAAPQKPAGGGDKSIDDLLDTALGAKPKPAASAAKPASENLAATPSRDDVLSAMKGITSSVQSCGKGESGVAMAKVTVTGATGKVSNAEIGGAFAGTPVGACVAKEVKKAKFPKFSQNTFSFSYPFKL